MLPQYIEFTPEEEAALDEAWQEIAAGEEQQAKVERRKQSATSKPSRPKKKPRPAGKTSR